MEEKKENSFYKWTVLIVIIIGTFMAVLDSSIVNIAISKMMTVFGVSVADAQWIITSYSLTMGAVIPLTGYLADRYGSKNMYIFSLIAFTLGSLLCGISWSNNMMIISRVLQGLGGGMIMPLGMTIIYSTFSKEERGMALGFWGIAAMAAPTIGPTLGGYIIEYVNWRLIFTINIPIGIVGVLSAWLLLKPSEKKSHLTFDYIGFITSSVGLVFILYVFGEGIVVWDIKNVLLMTIGIFSFIIFIINELTHPEPLMDLRVFKYMPFTMSMVISTFNTMAMFGVVFIMPLFLQNLRGFTPIQTGLIMLPSAVVMGVMMPIGGKLGDKFGAKPLVIAGSAITAFATYLMSSLNINTPMMFISLLLVIRAFGLGISMMTASTEGMNSVPHHLISRATAVNSTVRQVASSISITLLVGVMNRHQNLSFARLSEQVNSFNYNIMSTMGGIKSSLMANGASSAVAEVASNKLILGLISQQAFVSGINATLIVSSLMGLICIPLAFFFKKTKQDENLTDEEKAELEEAKAELSFEM